MNQQFNPHDPNANPQGWNQNYLNQDPRNANPQGWNQQQGFNQQNWSPQPMNNLGAQVPDFECRHKRRCYSKEEHDDRLERNRRKFNPNQ